MGRTHHVGIRVIVLAFVVLWSAGCVSTPEWYRKYHQPYQTQRSVDDVTVLYRAVSGSIIEHTCTQHPFHTKLENFDYSVGPIDALLQKHQADALVIVYGVDQISTNGRKALRGIGLVLGAVTGQPVVSQGMTALNIALVDRSGAVLWYKIAGDSGGFDLRDARSAKAFVQRLVSDFPAVGR